MSDRLIAFDMSELGNPVNDLAVATVLMVVGGKLVLLRPRKVCVYSLLAQLGSYLSLVWRRGSQL